jgi:molybdopterin-guanine dinucleotide biosynthesis protein A
MEATGVILAGGKSSRMQFNKAFANIGGKSIIDIITAKLRRLFKEVIIISNEPELYQGLGVNVYTDIYPGLGPVSGIHSALYHASYNTAFILGCDMPFINMGLVQYMFENLKDHDSVVPLIDNYLQPTSAVYSKKCLPILTDCLKNNKLKLVLVFRELDTVMIYEKEIERFGKIKEIFFNVNDLNALVQAREMAGRLL